MGHRQRCRHFIRSHGIFTRSARLAYNTLVAKWVKGQSGNPKGPPLKAVAVAGYIRAKAGGEGRAYIDKLHAIAVDAHGDTSARINAIKILLDRGWGPSDALPPSVTVTVGQFMHEHYPRLPQSPETQD